jgi:uncharacterized membrane protein
MNEKINQLLDQLQLLLKRQDDFANEINVLRDEIYRLKYSKDIPDKTDKQDLKSEMPLVATTVEYITPLQRANQIEETTSSNKVDNKPISTAANNRPSPSKIAKPKGTSNLEKFIGENLINKIGIVITVIGVAIGIKYTIENIGLHCCAWTDGCWHKTKGKISPL